jgi:hypothetical protein
MLTGLSMRIRRYRGRVRTFLGICVQTWNNMDRAALSMRIRRYRDHVRTFLGICVQTWNNMDRAIHHIPPKPKMTTFILQYPFLSIVVPFYPTNTELYIFNSIVKML